MTSSGSDIDLAERAARGDRAAAEQLVRRALPIVRGLARRLAGDPEEGDALAQDALVAALEGIERYRGDAAFSTWVCGIATRRYADIRRRKSAEQRAMQRTEPVRRRDPVEVAAARDAAQRIWELIPRLSSSHREALIARAVSDTTAQAAARLGITSNAMHVRLHRARLALRRLLMAHCPDLLEDIGYARK